MITIIEVIGLPGGYHLVLFSRPAQGILHPRTIECRFSCKAHQTSRETAKDGLRVTWKVAKLFEATIAKIESDREGWYVGDTTGRVAE